MCVYVCVTHTHILHVGYSTMSPGTGHCVKIHAF